MADDFLQRLQHEAQLQAQLHQHRLLPRQIDWLTSLIGRYSLQTILLLSFLTAIMLEVIK